MEQQQEHELMNNWTLYAHTYSESDNYSSSYIKLNEFYTCEGWARLFNNIPSAGTLATNVSEIRIKEKRVVAFSLFKEDIKPEWEDEKNVNGSEWGCRQDISEKDVSEIWKHLCVSVSCGDLEAIGVRIVNKNNYNRNITKIEVWMSQDQDPTVVYGKIHEILEGVKLEHDIPNFQLLYHDYKQKDAVDYSNKRKKHTRKY
jgi:hypothetical protein